MDYESSIQNVYDHLESDNVAKAVMTCLRIARHLKDYLNAAIFLRELYPDKTQVTHTLYSDIHHLKEEAQTFIWEKSAEVWLACHKLPYSLLPGDEEEGDNPKCILALGVDELESDRVRSVRHLRNVGKT